MTLDALMDSIKSVFMNAATGPLKVQAWRLIATEAGRELQSLLRHNQGFSRVSYSFHVVVDSNGRGEFNNRSIEEARESWLRTLLGTSAPEESLEVSGRIRRSGGTRAVVEITAIRRNPSRLEIGRGSSAPSERRRESSRASVRGGAESIDAEALASLSGSMRSSMGARRASAPLPEEPAGGR